MCYVIAKISRLFLAKVTSEYKFWTFEGGVCGHVLWFAISLALKASTSQLARQTRQKLAAHFHIFDGEKISFFNNWFKIDNPEMREEDFFNIMIIKNTFSKVCTLYLSPSDGNSIYIFTFNLNGLTIVNSLYVGLGILIFYPRRTLNPCFEILLFCYQNCSDLLWKKLF